jgi:hypothetical protein
VTAQHHSQPGEVPLKVWVQERAAAEGRSVGAIWNRYSLNRAKHFPRLRVRHVNKRVVFALEVAP